MAYETTYSSMLADQEDLISKYMEMDNEYDAQPEYNTAEATIPDEEKEEEEVPDDYEMLKQYYEENEAKGSLLDEDEDEDFLNFLFEGDNKYQSINNAPLTNLYNGYNSNSSLRSNIASLESGGNYKAESPNSSAKGKYQFIWSIHNRDIAKVTGVKSKDEFLNNPQAQEQYFDYWDRTTLTPSAEANLGKFKQYYPNATVDDVKKATHFAGRGNLEKALRTGNFTQGIDANNTSIQKYVFKN